MSAFLAPDLWLPLGVYSQLGSAFSDRDRQDADLSGAEELHA